MAFKAYTPATDIAAYTIVTFNSSNVVTTATGGANVLHGIADGAGAKAGELLQTAVSGIHKVKFGGSVGAGKPVTSNASGLAVAATEGDYAIGHTLDEPASEGDELAIIIDRSKL